MLDVNFEFACGILFVRLEGKINRDSVSSIKNNLIDIIKKGEIKYLVFNINKSVIEEKVDLFDDCNLLIKNNKGKMYICGLKNKIENVVNFECNTLNNELAALSKIRLC